MKPRAVPDSTRDMDAATVSGRLRDIFFVDPVMDDEGALRVELDVFWSTFPGGNPGYVEGQPDPIATVTEAFRKEVANWSCAWRTGGRVFLAVPMELGYGIQIDASSL